MNTFQDILEKFPLGKEVTGKVDVHAAFGMFLKIDMEIQDGVIGLIQVTTWGVFNNNTPNIPFPNVGTQIKCKVIQVLDGKFIEILLIPLEVLN